jgi:hypothetical protein
MFYRFLLTMPFGRLLFQFPTLKRKPSGFATRIHEHFARCYLVDFGVIPKLVILHCPSKQVISVSIFQETAGLDGVATSLHGQIH